MKTPTPLEIIAMGMDQRMADALVSANLERTRAALVLCLAQRNGILKAIEDRHGADDFFRETITFGNDQLADTLLGVGE